MRVTRLDLAGWRNLVDAQLSFPDRARLQVLFGDNAQGKTNVLEAIYFLSSFRSFRTSHAVDLLRHGSSRANLEATVVTSQLERAIEVELLREDSTATRAMVSRTIRVDGKAIRSTARAFGLLGAVLFVPEDLSLLRAAPSARRRFLDFAVSGVERAYFSEASDFLNVLRSRNAILRAGENRGSSAAMLDTYDEQLARAAARIVVRRRGLVTALEPHVRRFFSALHASLRVSLSYQSDPRVSESVEAPEITAALLRGLTERRAIDLRRRFTTFGPHLDDLEIRLDGRPAREHASQGQLRSLVLALKLAEVANLEAAAADSPVLLLDDVPSELDPSRRRHLFETLQSLSCQTFLTVADRTVVPSSVERAEFRVVSGAIEAV